jgi:hypothetical protein
MTRPLAYGKELAARRRNGERIGLLVVSVHDWEAGKWFEGRSEVARLVLPEDVPVGEADWSLCHGLDVVICGGASDVDFYAAASVVFHAVRPFATRSASRDHATGPSGQMAHHPSVPHRIAAAFPSGGVNLRWMTASPRDAQSTDMPTTTHPFSPTSRIGALSKFPHRLASASTSSTVGGLSNMLRNA